MEIAAEAYELVEQAAQKFQDELRVMDELRAAAGEVGRLRGRRPYDWISVGPERLTRMAEAYRVSPVPEIQRSLQDVRQQLQDLEATPIE